MSESCVEGRGKEDFVSDDKKKIADEEKEKMIDVGKEQEIRSGEVEKKKKALEEAVLGDVDKRRIPIGGIKIPGFLKSTKSREKSKEGEDNEEGTDLLEQPCMEVRVNDEKEKEARAGNQPKLPLLDKFSSMNVPFMKRKRTPETEEASKDPEDNIAPRRPNLINAIRLPLANLVPKRKPKDGEELGTQQAGLASMETLDDDSKHDDGMENIVLESVEVDPEKARLEDEVEQWALTDWKRHWRMIRQHKVAAAGVFVFVVLFLVLIATVLAGPRVPTHAPVVDGKYITAVTTCGLVEGVMESTAFVFRGIPYAKPPLGDLRFRPPQPHRLEDCWDGTLKLHNTTTKCWEIFANGSLNGGEDCLTLDVYTPHVRYDYPLPVIFIVGADSLMGGWPDDLIPEAEISHAKEVVLVRPNFRLGTLGFLAASALSQTTYPKTSGNYGLADVLRALEWTNLNIEHFGGDKNAVTVLGHKAGATLVSALTTILKPEKLFARVWISSGSTVFPNLTLYESERQTEEYLANMECVGNASAVADCLRTTEIEDMLDAIPESWRRQEEGILPKGEVKGHQWLVEDGVILRQHPLEVWSNRNLTIQVVIGTTLHSETSPEWWETHKTWSEEKINHELTYSQIGAENLINKVKSIYNMTVEGLGLMVSDISSLCPLYNMHKQIPFSKFYLVTRPSDDTGLTYGGADVGAIIGPYNYKLGPPGRRYLGSMRQMFYRFVALGLPPEHKFTEINQDVSKLDVHDIERRCNLWKEAGFDKFARLY